MKWNRSLFLRRLLLATLVLAAALLATDLRVRAVSTNLVISQLYGAGGNAGAVFNSDYIEIFNRGSEAVSLHGLSLQYASATGTGNFGAGANQITVLPNVTVAPGQYYLVKGAGGATGSPLPTPDFAPATPIAMGGTAGKVALVNSTTTLGCNGGSTPCSPSQLALIVDLVGYGTANFYEGAGPAPASSATLADFRTPSGSDTDNNASDFATGLPAPRNTASALGGTPAAAPGRVAPGWTSLLTVTVTPGANPTSTGLAVVADLTSIGGAAAQAFYDDGTHGDVSAADSVFSYQATIGAGTAAGAKSLAASISDAQWRSGTAAIALAVVPAVAIHDIQGSGSVSPYNGQVVSTSGIVTGIKTNAFFLQAPDSEADADPNTSEGLFVYTGTPLASVAAGDRVNVIGGVQEYYSMTELSGSLSVTVLTSGNPLPGIIGLTATQTDPAGGLEQLERYEGMRVSVPSLTVISPTFVSEVAGSPVSNGVFYGVITGLARPFREPGIDVSAPVIPGMPVGVPVFDGNPERLAVDSDAFGGSPLDVTTGVVVTNLAGPLEYAYGSYQIDAEVTPTVTANSVAVAVPAVPTGQFTVASFNLAQFFDTADASFTGRLNKVSLAIRNILRSPDIIGVQEVDTLATLQALANKVNADAGSPSPGYTAYLVEGNDLTGIDVGFLVRSSVTVTGVVQEGKDATFVDPRDSSVDLLNDRPPLVLRGTIAHPGGGAALPLTVVVTHMRSLVDVDANSPDGDYARAKRRKGAEFIANLLQGYQANGEHVIAVGDYNAFQFNDGYVDVLGTVLGAPTPSTEVLLASADLVDPNLSDLVTGLDPAERYSYIHDGNAQVLDHVLVSADMLPRVAQLVYARLDADFPGINQTDPDRPERVSDHDPALAYFTFPTPPCTSFSVSPTTANPTYAAGSQVVTVTGSPAGCTGGDWTASGNGDWITVSSASGSGSGSVTVAWTQNASTSSRPGTAVIAGASFAVVQDGAPPPTCTSVSISPTSANPTDAAGSQVVTVTGSPAGCTGGDWTASGEGSWLAVSPTSGSGSGSVTVVWTQNASTSSRSGTAVIAGASFAVTQGGAPPPTCTSVSISPTSANSTFAAGSQVVTVTGSPAGCTGGNWTAAGNGDWITVSSANGSGSGSVTVAWTENTSPTSRSDNATIAGNSFGVTQGGIPISPAVTTEPATAIGQTDATLNGTANPNGSATTAYFEYGVTASYGTTTSSQSVGSGTSSVGVSGAVTGLRCGTSYHFRLVGTSSAGTSNGTDQAFTTSACPTPTLTVALAGSGGGAVTSVPAGITCGTDCTETYEFDTSVTLAVGPRADSVFAGWTGDADCTDGTVDIDTDRACTANFVTRLGRRVTRGSLDLNLDGAGDVFRYNPASGDWSMDFSLRAGTFGSSTGTWSPDWRVYPADFNNDGLTDFLLYSRATGVAYQLDNTGAAFNYSRVDWSPGWDITVLDFDGDGRSDLFLYNSANGVWFRALNVGLGIDRYVYTTGNPWSDGFVVSKGDFNGDGRDDLFLYHDGAGSWWEVLTTPVGSSALNDRMDFTYAGGIMSEGWTVTIGDFNGDGRSDILLYRPTDGIWFEAISLAVRDDWRQLGWASAERFDWSRTGRWDAGFIVSKGDFDGDGRVDLILYHPVVGTWWQALTGPDGTLTTWNGESLSQGWEVSVTDLDGDGRDDVLLYQPTDGTWFTAISTGPGTFTWTSGNWGTGWTIIASR